MCGESFQMCFKSVKRKNVKDWTQELIQGGAFYNLVQPQKQQLKRSSSKSFLQFGEIEVKKMDSASLKVC